MTSAHRQQYMPRVKGMAGPLSEDERTTVANTPDWFMPIWIRAGVRLLNGVPHPKVLRLLSEEVSLARAKLARAKGLDS